MKRRYRAVVINGRRAFKCIMLCVVLAFMSTVCISAAKNIKKDGKDFSDFIGSAGEIIFGFDIRNPETIIYNQIPALKMANSGALSYMTKNGVKEAYNAQNADKGQGTEPKADDLKPIKKVDSSQKKALGNKNKKVLVNNQSGYEIDADKMLGEKLKISINGEGPKVLIIHTHSTESYSAPGLTYNKNQGDRSQNREVSVVKVGTVMTDILNSAGIETLHDTKLHDYPNYNGSYADALKSIEQYKAQYPSIQIVLDVHRDAIVYDDGTKVKVVTEVDGKQSAQVMFVVGTNAGGLEHPAWKENMKFAAQLQNYICEKYPTLMRSVNLRKERFNGHTSYGSIIIEVGTSGNTLDEAVYAGQLGATAIAEFLNSI